MELTSSFALPAPAKINRLLHIIGRRSDGYHLLQTLFQFIDWHDTLFFEKRHDNKIVLHVEDTSLATPNNLVYRAALLLQNLAPSRVGATITLQKCLPIGAGLGGGSSDAATTLIGLNLLWELALPFETLFSVGRTLGADVPIFLLGHSAWGEGIGDQLTPTVLDEPWIVLLRPACQVPTAMMYGLPELTRNTPPFTIGPPSDHKIKMIVGAGKNDFEPVVCQRFPAVLEAMKWLSNFGKAQLSGSGASVFSCFADESIARGVIEHLPTTMEGIVVKALNHSPLKQAWNSIKKVGILHAEDYWGVAKR